MADNNIKNKKYKKVLLPLFYITLSLLSMFTINYLGQITIYYKFFTLILNIIFFTVLGMTILYIFYLYWIISRYYSNLHPVTLSLFVSSVFPVLFTVTSFLQSKAWLDYAKSQGIDDIAGQSLLILFNICAISSGIIPPLMARFDNEFDRLYSLAEKKLDTITKDTSVSIKSAIEDEIKPNEWKDYLSSLNNLIQNERIDRALMLEKVRDNIAKLQETGAQSAAYQFMSHAIRSHDFGKIPILGNLKIFFKVSDNPENDLIKHASSKGHDLIASPKWISISSHHSFNFDFSILEVNGKIRHTTAEDFFTKSGSDLSYLAKKMVQPYAVMPFETYAKTLDAWEEIGVLPVYPIPRSLWKTIRENASDLNEDEKLKAIRTLPWASSTFSVNSNETEKVEYLRNILESTPVANVANIDDPEYQNILKKIVNEGHGNISIIIMVRKKKPDNNGKKPLVYHIVKYNSLFDDNGIIIEENYDYIKSSIINKNSPNSDHIINIVESKYHENDDLFGFYYPIFDNLDEFIKDNVEINDDITIISMNSYLGIKNINSTSFYSQSSFEFPAGWISHLLSVNMQVEGSVVLDASVPIVIYSSIPAKIKLSDYDSTTRSVNIDPEIKGSTILLAPSDNIVARWQFKSN